jgi:hypothetical protein
VGDRDEGDEVEEKGEEPTGDGDMDTVQEVRGACHRPSQSHRTINVDLLPTV